VRILLIVFNTNTRPWINPKKANPEEITNVIDHFTSGALQYAMNKDI